MPDDDQPESWVNAPAAAQPKTQSASQELFESKRLNECAAICKHVYNPGKDENQKRIEDAGLKTVTDGSVIEQFKQDNRFQVGDDGSIVNKKNGLKVSIYKDNQNNVTVGIAGSAMGANDRTLKTWGNNFKAGVGAIPSHDRQALEIVQACQEAYGKDSVSVTGHSAGGRAAAYASLASGAPALTINADGLGRGFQNNPVIGPKINGPEAQRIVQVRTNHDELGAALKILPNQLPGSDINMVGTRGKTGHGMGSVLKSLENPLENRADLVAKERAQGNDLSAQMTPEQAKNIRAFAVMAKDVYNATKPENMTERREAGLSRVGRDELNQLPGMANKLAEKGWQLDGNGTISQPKTGLKAAVYMQQDGSCAVSIAGTEAHLNKRMPVTWLNNAKAAVGFNCQHDKEARDLVKMVQRKFGDDKVSVVGHSAGGRAATYAALQNHAPGYTFNSDGLGPRYRLNPDVAKKLDSLDAQNITQVRTNQDWLKPVVDHGLSRLPGSQIIIAGDGGHSMKAVLSAMNASENPAQAVAAKKSAEIKALEGHIEKLSEKIDKLNDKKKHLESSASVKDHLKDLIQHGPQGVSGEIAKIKREIQAAELALETVRNDQDVSQLKTAVDGLKGALQSGKAEIDQAKIDRKAVEEVLKDASMNQQLLGSSLSADDGNELAKVVNKAINVREDLGSKINQLKEANQDIKAEIKLGEKALSVREKLGAKIGKTSPAEPSAGLSL